MARQVGKSAADATLYWLGTTVLNSSQALENLAKNLRGNVGAFLAQSMTPEERERLSLERYSSSTREPKPNQQLRGWEQRWFAEDLPPPPAKLLLAGCGGGRELVPLIESGYELVAFDGAPGAAQMATRLADGRADVRCATFDDLVHAVEGNAESPLADLANRTFDAVIVGWGALTHCAGSARRRTFLRTCHQLTDGNILASFYSKPGESLSRSGRWGRKVADLLKRPVPGPSPVEFSHWGGFAEYITKEELATHSAAIGRDVKWTEGGDVPFPHVTLTRRTP